MKVDNELLYKFFAKETSLEEADAIALWAKEKKSNQEQFRKAYKLFLIVLYRETLEIASKEK